MRDFQKRPKKVGIIGVSGYTGLELVKLIINHNFFSLKYLANTSGQTTLHAIFPSLCGAVENLAVESLDFSKIKELDLVFLALPHKESMQIVPRILALGVKVVDLSADYRLNCENYEAYYCKHTDAKNLKNAVYGLIEWNRDAIKCANLIANPGCYPTATLLGLLPFIPYLGDKSIFIDAKSGVSGAGKKLTDNTHFSHINENMFAYSPFIHRHSIEIAEKCEFFDKKNANNSRKNSRDSRLKKVSQDSRDSALKINFIPHLSPFTRGMLVSIFAKLKEPLNPREILRKCYQNEPFIRIRDNPVSVKNTAGSHFCDIFALSNECDLFISISIDNLLRGASSQALANANLTLGISEAQGLPKIAYVP